MLVIRRSSDRKKLEISALIFGHENATKKTKDGQKVGGISFLPHFYPTFPKINFREFPDYINFRESEVKMG